MSPTLVNIVFLSLVIVLKTLSYPRKTCSFLKKTSQLKLNIKFSILLNKHPEKKSKSYKSINKCMVIKHCLWWAKWKWKMMMIIMKLMVSFIAISILKFTSFPNVFAKQRTTFQRQLVEYFLINTRFSFSFNFNESILNIVNKFSM